MFVLFFLWQYFVAGSFVYYRHFCHFEKSLQHAPFAFCVLDKMWLRVRKSSWGCYSNWEQELDTCNRKILWSSQYSALIKARVLWKALVSCHFSSCLFFFRSSLTAYAKALWLLRSHTDGASLTVYHQISSEATQSSNDRVAKQCTGDALTCANYLVSEAY